MSEPKAKIIRPAKKLTDAEKQKIMSAFDDAQAWAQAVSLTEQDITDAIREVRQEKSQTRRQSA